MERLSRAIGSTGSAAVSAIMGPGDHQSSRVWRTLSAALPVMQFMSGMMSDAELLSSVASQFARRTVPGPAPRTDI